GCLLVGFFYWQAGTLGKRIEDDEKMLRKLATHDGLTGLYSRRMFHQLLERDLLNASRFNHPLSLLMIDIDFFKKVNDHYGHIAGDKVLMELSRRIDRTVREVDHACRYGGEEIAVILPETDIDGATILVERLLTTVSGKSFRIDDTTAIPLTVSIGVASFPQHGETDIMLISMADRALYKAKRCGRNRFEVAVLESEAATSGE
ncbi:MAG: diguanylate cyclase, partial [Chromatiales bacterium]|nr:diguanylate cyclase [Chromatiales bacterium]